MATTLPRPCNAPRCPELVRETAYCAEHGDLALEPAREYARQRHENDWTQAFYRSARWRRTRTSFLRRHPLCQPCGDAGRVTPATLVHHDPPLRELPPNERHDWRWLHPYCDRCHNQFHHAGGRR